MVFFCSQMFIMLVVINSANIVEDLFSVNIEQLLNDGDAIQSYSNQLKNAGYFKINNLLNSNAARSLSELLSKSTRVRIDYWTNPWQIREINDDYPPNHPMNHMTHQKSEQVGRSDIPQIFIDLYNYKPLLQLFQTIALNNNYKSLYLSSDPEGSVYGLILTEGDIAGHHFDEHPFSCVFMLQKALNNSGEFSYIRLEPIKYESDNGNNDIRFEWDFDLMNGLNIRDENVLNNHLKEISDVSNGDCYCFEGNITMHEVTTVIGDVDRIVFVMAYHEIKNFKHIGSVSENNKWTDNTNNTHIEL